MSSLGELSKVDWQTLFSSFFSVIRVKVNCNDPKKIPIKRVVEMDDQLFLLQFTVEDVEQIEEGHRGSEDKGDDSGDEDEDPVGDAPGDDQRPEREKAMGKIRKTEKETIAKIRRAKSKHLRIGKSQARGQDL